MFGWIGNKVDREELLERMEQLNWVKHNFPIGKEFEYLQTTLKVSAYKLADMSWYYTTSEQVYLSIMASVHPPMIGARYINSVGEICSQVFGVNQLKAIIKDEESKSE